MQLVIKIKRDKKENIENSNLVLRLGEFCMSTDKGDIYVGDGETPVKDLTPCGKLESDLLGKILLYWDKI